MGPQATCILSRAALPGKRAVGANSTLAAYRTAPLAASRTPRLPTFNVRVSRIAGPARPQCRLFPSRLALRNGESIRTMKSSNPSPPGNRRSRPNGEALGAIPRERAESPPEQEARTGPETRTDNKEARAEANGTEVRVHVVERALSVRIASSHAPRPERDRQGPAVGSRASARIRRRRSGRERPD